MTSNQNRKQQIKIKNINKNQSKATGQMAAEVTNLLNSTSLQALQPYV